MKRQLRIRADVSVKHLKPDTIENIGYETFKTYSDFNFDINI
jgi:hypothetical protein